MAALHSSKSVLAGETDMKRTTWLRRTLWITPIVLLLLAGAGLAVLKSYLSSAAAVRQVAEELQGMLGGSVEVQGAQISLIGNSTVHGIEAYEDEKTSKPWLRIDDVAADVSAFSLLRGKSPENIDLQGARLFLRFDRDGRLLTKLPTKKKGAPEQLPIIHIERGELTFDQQHRSPMVIRGVQAELASGKNGLMLTGTVSDPFWGNWKANGDFTSNGSQGSLSLGTEEVAVTMTKLKSIPFVPPSVWREVHIEGTTPAQLRLSMETTDDQTSVHYRIEISPADARVQVPSIDLDATQVKGKAVVADEIVEVDNAIGQTAGGSITTSGKLNFHDETTRLTFKAGVEDVVLHDLPRSWNVPKDIDGKLTGSANLVVTILNGKVQTAGSGAGVIRGASWSGFSIDKPIRLSLHSDNGRFHFRPHEPTTGTALAPREQLEVQTRANYSKPEPQNVDLVANEPADEGDLFQNAPTEIVNLLDRGIKMAADGLSKGIDSAAQALGKLKPPSKPGEQPTYLDVDLNLQNVDVAQLVQKLKLNLPYTITGRLTFQVHASIPINTAGDLKAYRLRGTAKLPTFNMAGLAMTNVEAKVRYADGVLDLESLSGQIPSAKDTKSAGKFSGDARVEVVPRGDLRASLKLDQIPLATLVSLVPQIRGDVAGVLSGTVQARAPLMKLSDPANWRGAANLNVPSVKVFGLPLRNAAVNLVVDDTRAQLLNLKANLEGAPLTGQGEVQLQGAYPFKAEVHLGNGDLTALDRLAPAFRPPFELRGQTQLDGKLSGTLKPLQFDTSGQLHAKNLVVERFALDELSFRWLKDNGDMKLDAIRMELYGGSVSGSARLPIEATAPGGADLDIRNLDVKALAKALPVLPVRLEGKVSGTVKGKLAPSAGEHPRAWTSDIEVSAPQMRVQGIPAEKLKGTIDSRDGKTTYNLKGETLGGTFTIKGDVPLPSKNEEKKPPQEPPPGKQARNAGDGRSDPSPALRACACVADEQGGSGTFELRDARLSRLWPAYDIAGPLANLKGRFSIFINYRHIGPGMAPIGDGSFRIINVRWGDEFLGDSLQGGVRLTAFAFELVNVTGNVAGGLFLGRFSFGLKPNSRSGYHIDLQQVEASRLLVPIPAVAAHVKGPVDVNLRGNIGRDWDGSGGATLVRGQIYGMSITEWRIPMTFSFSPTQGSGELAIRDSQARLALGRARFEGTLNWGNGLRLVGLLLYYDVDLRTLLHNAPGVSSYASGRVSGRVDLAGNEMRSMNDLTALVQAKMTQGQALQMPVLRQITPYLRPGASSSTFQSGELKGRLAGGIFRIENATLVGDFIKMLILGTINLAGNLNLEVTAQSGLYCLNPARTNSISSRIPIVGAIPRLLLYEASTLLAAAVVHLRVTGTVSAPVVRLEPLVTLTEDAVRFFLGVPLRLAIPNMP
jgi:translocation and assembly module TamB